jgi:hypothetical protein
MMMMIDDVDDDVDDDDVNDDDSIPYDCNISHIDSDTSSISTPSTSFSNEAETENTGLSQSKQK